MFEFLLCNDMTLIKAVLMSGHNKPYQIQDDEVIDFNLWKPEERKDVINLAVMEDGVFQGFFFLIKTSPNACEAHLGFLPSAYGRVAEAGRECAKLLFEATEIEHITCPVIESNRLAVRCVERMGFKQYDRKEKMFLKDGKWEDYVYLKLDKL